MTRDGLGSRLSDDNNLSGEAVSDRIGVQRGGSRHHGVHREAIDDALPGRMAQARTAVTAEMDQVEDRRRQRIRIAGRNDHAGLTDDLTQSPQSVTTHGTPHAMASPTAFENPSPYTDAEHPMSSAG